MPNFKNIKALIYANRWAILPESLAAIVSFLEGADISDLNRDDFHKVSAEQWSALTAGFGELADETKYTRVSGNVGLLEISGPLIPKATWLDEVSGLVSTSVLSAEFSALDEDPAIEKIVLLFDSPGGIITGISEFAQAVKAAETPTLAFVAGVAASAAYWIASSADAIAMIDTGIVGSIGTIMTFYIHEDNESIEIVSSQSPLKNVDPKSKAGRKEYQTIVDDLAAVFIDAVAENRGVTPEIVQKNYGQGMVMVGTRALKAGMIDTIGTLRGALGSEIPERTAVTAEQRELDLNADAKTGKENETETAKNKNEPREPEKSKEKGLTTTVKISTNDQGHPKTTKTEDRPMAELKDLVEANPEIEAEITEFKAAAEKKGADSVVARVETTYPILTSPSYPEPIKAVAREFIEGTKTEAEYKAAVAGFDVATEAARAELAESETEGTETPPQPPEGGAFDGVVTDEASYQAAQASFKASRGER